MEPTLELRDLEKNGRIARFAGSGFSIAKKGFPGI